MDAPSKPVVDHTRRIGWHEAPRQKQPKADEWRALRERLRGVDDELRRLAMQRQSDAAEEGHPPPGDHDAVVEFRIEGRPPRNRSSARAGSPLGLELLAISE